jgi:hypothetical protein
VRDQLVVRPFGGKNTRIMFDGRTQIYRDGVLTSAHDLKEGERVYVDTVQDGTMVFAKNIRIVSKGVSSEGRGQVLSYRPERSEFLLRDGLSPEPVRVRVTAATVFLRNDKTVPAAQLAPGDVVAVRMQRVGGDAVATEVSILAAAGTVYTFAGRVSYLDLHAGLMAIVDPRDQKSYDVTFDPARMRLSPELREGADVSVAAGFDGVRYKANSITVNSHPQ